jgi:D-xylose transport system substrate-binding protein
MKSRCLVALAACTVLAFAGCGEERGDDDSSIYILLPANRSDHEPFEEKVDELCPDCGSLYEEAGGDAGTQQEQAEEALAEGADVLVVDPVDGAAGAAIVAAAHAHDVPVIGYNAFAPGADLYVGFDDAAIGKLQAQALVDKLEADESEGPIVMLNGPANDENARGFKLAAHSVIDDSAFNVAREYDTAGWSAAGAQSEMADAIAHLGPDGFTGVYAATDALAGGAIAALEAAGIDPSSVPVTGQDADPAALERIEDGEQYMTVRRPFDALAERAGELAVDLADGKRPDETVVRIEPEALTAGDL